MADGTAINTLDLFEEAYLKGAGEVLEGGSPAKQANIDAIRRFGDGAGDYNPLFRDEEHAARSRFGMLTASPMFIYSVGGLGVRAAINGNIDQTDDHSYNIVSDPVHINDMNATLLRQMGIDHERLTYRFLGLDQRLTGVEDPKVIPQLIA